VIIQSRATLSVYSELLSVAEITRLLDTEPHESVERGASTRAKWSYRANPASIDRSDGSGFAAVQVIADAFRDHAMALRDLRESCEIILWWSGDSDSSQGGFVIPSALLVDLADMGCDLYGTAFLSGADE
jgi:hypothetical protein